MLTTTGTPGHTRRFLLAAVFVSLAACKMGTVNTVPHASSIAVSVEPAEASVDTGGSVTFTAAVTGTSNTAVSWSVIGEGSITAGGVYTAPATPGTYQVVAISLADASRSGTATVTVSAPSAGPVAVTVSPESASVATGGVVSFTAAVTGATDTSVTWSVTGGDPSGTIDAAGVYTAPGTGGTYVVVATSVADTTKTATASVTVSPPPPPTSTVSVTVSPSTASIATGASLQLRATVTGAANTAVTWSVTGGASNGTVTAAGRYTAPATAGTYTVVATSVADTTASASATVTVTAPAPVITVSINPPYASIAPGGTTTFTATVAGTTSTTVTWSVVGGSANGSITSAGVYSAPSAAGTYTVVATSVADTTKSAAATVYVSVPGTVVINVQPTTMIVRPGGAAAFTGVVSGTGNAIVTWSVTGGAGNGSVSTGGVYTAPSTAGTYTVVATSAADPTKSASATVTVGDNRAGTDVPAGAITTRTWTPAGSPYRILGDVYIPSGNRLTIQPGVEVRVQGHYRIEGPGIIDARGTSPTQRDILFTAEDKTRGWYGIYIWNGTGQLYVPPDSGDYHLENCIIEYAVKDRSSARSWGDVAYSDSRGAVYVYGGLNGGSAGVMLSNLHFNGLLLRHNVSNAMVSPKSMGGAIYMNTVGGSVTWTDVVFDDNITVDYGGAIAVHHLGGMITFKNGMMNNNVCTVPEQPGTGGAIGYWDVAAGGGVTLDHVVYQGNDPAGFATAEAPDVVVINPP